MKKNIIKLLAILAMCFMVVGVLASCGKEEAPAADENNNQNQTTTPEMYIKDGTYWVGDFNTGFPASDDDREYCIDHEWHHVHTTQEHTQDGKPEIIFYGCLDCNYCYTVEVGHVFEKVETVAPTCVTYGYDLYECRCGATEERAIVDALGHDLPVWNAAWTHETVDTTVWNAITTIAAADCPCEFVGKYDAKCTRCDVRTEVKETVKVEHSYTKYYEAITDPSINPCENAVVEIAMCDKCNNKDNIAVHSECRHCNSFKEKTPAPGHDFGAWYWVTEPTATTAGTLRHDCKGRDGYNCQGFEEVTVAAWNETDYTYTHKEPDCVKAGEDKYVFTKGGQSWTFTAPITSKGGHRIEGQTAKNLTIPTKTATGSVEVTCKACNEVLTFTLPKLPQLAVEFTAGTYGDYYVVPGNCKETELADKYTYVLKDGEVDVFENEKVEVTFEVEDATLHPHHLEYDRDTKAGCIKAFDEKTQTYGWFALCTGECNKWVYVGPVED